MNRARLAAPVLALPVIAGAAVSLALAAAGGTVSSASAVCGPAGTGSTVAGVSLDAEQMSNAEIVVTVVAQRSLPVYAADIAVTTAYTESRLHNTLVETDHDSEGLFQQRVSIYTKPVADDPVKATNAFLDRLLRLPGWAAQPIGVDAQAVQNSSRPERYAANATLGTRLAGLLWPTAGIGQLPAVCRDEVAVGPGGNPVTGTTFIPPDLVITGSTRAQSAVRFALAQLGTPYVFGAAGPGAWDCSGLVMGAWASVGVALPHLASSQAQMGTPLPNDLATAVGGDLVFVAGADGTASAPGHVGMIVGFVQRTDGRHLLLIQASTSGVPVELTDAQAWAGLIVAVRRVDPT